MSEGIDERCRRVATEMRQVIFREFGEPEKMDETAMNDCIRTIIAIHAGELVDFAARFASPGRPVRDACIHMIDMMIEGNAEEVARLLGRANQREFLLGEQPCPK